MEARMHPTTRPTARQRLQLALETGHGLRTIDNVYLGKRTHVGTYARCVDAARKIGAPLPPAPTAQPELGERVVDIEAAG
jgi:hypothetical protein